MKTFLCLNVFFNSRRCSKSFVPYIAHIPFAPPPFPSTPINRHDKTHTHTHTHTHKAAHTQTRARSRQHTHAHTHAKHSCMAFGCCSKTLSLIAAPNHFKSTQCKTTSLLIRSCYTSCFCLLFIAYVYFIELLQ